MSSQARAEYWRLDEDKSGQIFVLVHLLVARCLLDGGWRRVPAQLGNFHCSKATCMRIWGGMGERFVRQASSAFFAASRDAVEADQSEAFWNLYLLSLTATVAAAQLMLRTRDSAPPLARRRVHRSAFNF